MATQKRYPMKSSGPLDNMEMTTEDEEKKEPKSDRWNLAILLLLYMLQGIPLGLAGSMPMVLQAKRIGYRQQAVFSFVSWPFSIKLLWAPIVDSLYNSQFGRRKSWLVPAQYVIGITMIMLSYSINDLIGADGVSPNILMLTLSFLILYMCAATQDIAVDGWAISMLSRENVGHASTCNSVGQTAGYFIGYTIFLALESKEFCNTYLRSVPQDYGLIDIQGFMFYFGFIFIIVTSCIMLFKKEKNDANINPETKNDIYSAYQQLLMLFKLRPVQVYAVFLLTAKIAFAAADNITGLKLIEAGLPRENIALIALPIAPIQILLPLVISRYIAGPRPMDLYFKAVPFRMLMSLMFGVMVWWTNQIPTAAKGEFPVYYYVILVTSFLVHQVMNR
jgi:PAT family acetyl-CoA transporter-like MFS transporter 1